MNDLGHYFGIFLLLSIVKLALDWPLFVVVAVMLLLWLVLLWSAVASVLNAFIIKTKEVLLFVVVLVLVLVRIRMVGTGKFVWQYLS